HHSRPRPARALPWPFGGIDHLRSPCTTNGVSAPSYPHGQSVAELAEEGGIDWSEMVAVLEDRPWHWMSVDEAAERLEELFADWVFMLPKQMKAMRSAGNDIG